MDGIIDKSTTPASEQALWLPIMEYAQRSGISVSTLRRKIKTKEVEYKMDEGRYLIKCSLDSLDGTPNLGAYASSDTMKVLQEELAEMIRQTKAENALQWRALEARVVGLSRRVEVFSEQIAELKMLVKIFEEKLDTRG